MQKTSMLQTETHPWLTERTILLVKSGSHAYGTNLPTSDKDFKGVCVPPIEYYLGLHNFESYDFNKNNHTRNTSEDTDMTIYGMKKFIKLAMNSNPNIIEMLYTDKDSIVSITPQGEELVSHRDEFLSNRLTSSFGGFAKAQKNKLDKGLSQRKDIVEKYGYDTKTLMHTVRLYEMGIECFLTGTMRTKRPNADELVAIRNGLYTKSEVVPLLDKLEDEFQLARKNSILEDEPNKEKIEEFVIRLTESMLR